MELWDILDENGNFTGVVLEKEDERTWKENSYHQGVDAWLDVYLIKQDVDIDKLKLRPEEVSEIKFASFDEVEEIYKNNMFMKNGWEYVRDDIKKVINN